MVGDEDDFFKSKPASPGDDSVLKKNTKAAESGSFGDDSHLELISSADSASAAVLSSSGAGEQSGSGNESELEADTNLATSSRQLKNDGANNAKRADTNSSSSKFEERTSGGGAAAAIEPSSIPPALRVLMGHYFVIAQKLLLSPLRFYKEMDLSSSISEPLSFLAVSAAANAIISAVFQGFNLLKIPGDFLGQMIISSVVAGITFGMAKGMGSKANFASVLRIFAFCSCLSVLSAVPGLGIVLSLYGVVLQFFGLREIVKVSLYQTCTLMFLLCFLQVIIGLGQALRH